MIGYGLIFIANLFKMISDILLVLSLGAYDWKVYNDALFQGEIVCYGRFCNT